MSVHRDCRERPEFRGTDSYDVAAGSCQNSGAAGIAMTVAIFVSVFQLAGIRQVLCAGTTSSIAGPRRHSGSLCAGAADCAGDAHQPPITARISIMTRGWRCCWFCLPL